MSTSLKKDKISGTLFNSLLLLLHFTILNSVSVRYQQPTAISKHGHFQWKTGLKMITVTATTFDHSRLLNTDINILNARIALSDEICKKIMYDYYNFVSCTHCQ